MGEAGKVILEQRGNGVFTAPGARLIDRSGRKKTPIGEDGFEAAMERSVLVDKTMLIADVLAGAGKVTLFCRPRRFGKSLNMTMLRAFLELPPEGEPSREPLFEGTDVWEAEDGRYRRFQGAFPVIYLSFNTVKKNSWEMSHAEIKALVSNEYRRHAYLGASAKLNDDEKAYFVRVRSGKADDAEYARSLIQLALMLQKHHGQKAVILIDEYDAPVMAGYSAPNGGYYAEVVSFLKGWLTGALKDGGAALAFSCLTGVQRISKESIFSDLNNLVVNTSLSLDSDERYGFTEDEVAALATYLGHEAHIDEAREWYDGYRFGAVDVYNPWSLINYLDQRCMPGLYWSNTSSNAVVGDLVRNADRETLLKVYRLLEPGGTVTTKLDLGVVFPDVGVREGAVWSMLYLAGYLTTEDVFAPEDFTLPRRVRIPNKEVAKLFRYEVVERYGALAGGSDRLLDLSAALVAGDERKTTAQLRRIAMNSASTHDLVSENSVHMLMLGLCYGIVGYADPRSNREEGFGRFDIRIEPVYVAPGSPESWTAATSRPRITVETKFAKASDAPEDEDALEAKLEAMCAEALGQIEKKAYDAGDLPACATGRLRWGVAFCGKHVLARCARA